MLQNLLLWAFTVKDMYSCYFQDCPDEILLIYNLLYAEWFQAVPLQLNPIL